LKKNKDFTKIKATLTAVGKGETQPAKDDEGGKNKTNAALNRRVEFIIDGKPAFDYSKI
jgi:outer membrane protein OmpA-like peptidoglycan-associated protein